MVDLFETLQAESPDLGEHIEKLTKMMSTHPLTEDRIQRANDLIDGLSKTDYPERPALAAIFKNLQSPNKKVGVELENEVKSEKEGK